MPCDARIRVRVYNTANFMQVAKSMGFAVSETDTAINVMGFGQQKTFNKNSLANLSTEEARSMLGKTVQTYAAKQAIEAARKQGFRATQKQVQNKIEITVEA